MQTNLKETLLSEMIVCFYTLKNGIQIHYSNLKLIIQMEFIYVGCTKTEMKKSKVMGKVKR